MNAHSCHIYNVIHFRILSRFGYVHNFVSFDIKIIELGFKNLTFNIKRKLTFSNGLSSLTI